MIDGKRVIKYFQHKSWPIYALNIVHIVGASAEDWSVNQNQQDQWNDALCVVKDTGEVLLSNLGSTDPGSYWEQNPMNEAGCAIIALGHHPKSHQLGLHHGYPALVQADSSQGDGIGGILIYRDSEANGIRRGNAYIAYDCGLNIHSGRGTDCTSDEVGMYSAGCQVRKYWDSHITFYNLMKDSGRELFDLNLISGLELFSFNG